MERAALLILALFASATSFAQSISPSTIFSQPDAGAQPRSFLDKARDFKSARDYAGVKCDGTTDDTRGIQAGLNSGTTGSGVLRIPGNLGTRPCRITSALQMPRTYGAAIVGESPYTSRITQASSSANGINFNFPYYTGSYYSTLRDLAVTGPNGGTGVGVLTAGAHSITMDNVVITGWDHGVRLGDSIIANYNGCRVQSNRIGFSYDGIGVSPTAQSLNGCYVAGNSEHGYSLYSTYGMSITGGGIEGNQRGGFTVTTAGGGIGAIGVYLEQNTDTVGTSHDWFAGADSYVRGVALIAPYINGRGPGGTYDYRPIRLGFADAHLYTNAFVNDGDRLYSFSAGATVTNSTFGPVGYGPAFDRTDPSTVYENMPADIASPLLGNTFDDPVVLPTDGQNLLSGTGPSAWTQALGAGSTATVSASRLNGQLTTQLTRTTAVAQLYREVAVTATSNSRVRNRFVSFCADLLVTNADARNVTITLGDGATSSTKTYALTAAMGQRRYCISHKAASGTTTLTAVIDAGSNDTALLIAAETLFVGMNTKAAPQFARVPDWTLQDLRGATAFDPGNIAAGSGQTEAVSVPYAALGDYAMCSFSNDLQSMALTGYVSAANTVSCRFQNGTGGAIDLAAGTLRARVIPQ